ncbi:hypothetical protein NDU88_000310 [Pleurodeles waltl]|uniref:Uncharacterized protein n=1 Tax=Pleurodeles waltl TaxID=8319 RepID=A0AAV7V762_PLEWA|nr:hypothetical protein NDU88_000310 [Pleurodeles waltl]
MASTMDMREFYENYSDARKVREAYFIQESSFFDDLVTRVFSNFIKCLSSGDVRGDTVLGLSFGPVIFYTLPLCEYFNEINFACPTDKSIQEIKNWLKSVPDALDWSDAAKMICELHGSGGTWIEKQHTLKRKVKSLYKLDVTSRNPLSPIIHPQADCLLLVHCLENLVSDEKSYCEALTNVSSLLKPGGHLLMIAALEATFFMVGDVTFPLLCIDKCFLKDALIGAGYVIEEFHLIPRKLMRLHDRGDYKYFVFLKAKKENCNPPIDKEETVQGNLLEK